MRGDTIVAVATPPGRGGIGVVRLSGSAVPNLAAALVRRELPARRAVLCAFFDQRGEMIDEGIALRFAAPASFTGEDVVELQAHGSPVLLQMLVDRCVELGARLAEPGEFSLRAFLNNRLDLAQAEAVADLIDAQTTAAARAAMRSFSGEFSRRIGALVDALVQLRMYVEAALDFPEEDVDFVRAADAVGQLGTIRETLAVVLGSARQGRLLRDGVHVVLIGQPNVGKSSLLNRLAGEEVAIVTPVAGTTRDTIRQAVQIAGVPLHAIDTAGLRDTQDSVEQLGIARTWAAVDRADLAVVLVESPHGLAAADLRIIERLPDRLPLIVVHNKIDLSGERPRVEKVGEQVHVRLSAKTGAGIELLERELLGAVGYEAGEAGAVSARARHLAALRAAQDRLAAAAGEIERPEPALELFADELRAAQDALSTITGEFTADDLLGEIFGRFCIGK